MERERVEGETDRLTETQRETAIVLTNEVEGVRKPRGQVSAVAVLHGDDLIAEVLREVVSAARGHVEDGGDVQLLKMLLHAGMAGVSDVQIWQQLHWGHLRTGRKIRDGDT